MKSMTGLLILGMLSGSLGASAATLIVTDGELTGASGVRVDGNLYDIKVGDGSCIELFDGCDSVSDSHLRTETPLSVPAGRCSSRSSSMEQPASLIPTPGSPGGARTSRAISSVWFTRPLTWGTSIPRVPTCSWWITPRLTTGTCIGGKIPVMSITCCCQAFDTTHDHLAPCETWARWDAARARTHARTRHARAARSRPCRSRPEPEAKSGLNVGSYIK